MHFSLTTISWQIERKKEASLEQEKTHVLCGENFGRRQPHERMGLSLSRVYEAVICYPLWRQKK